MDRLAKVTEKCRKQKEIYYDFRKICDYLASTGLYEKKD